MRSGAWLRNPGGALDTSAVCGDPPQTPVGVRPREITAAEDRQRGFEHRAHRRCTRRVAGRGTRVECSTRASRRSATMSAA